MIPRRCQGALLILVVDSYPGLLVVMLGEYGEVSYIAELTSLNQK
jgi:hypothetical protein